MEMLNTRAVAELLDLPKMEVVRRIRKGDIKATKWGWNWAVEAAEVDRVKKSEWYKKHQKRQGAAA